VVVGAEQTEGEGEELPEKVGSVVLYGVELKKRFMWRTYASGGRALCKLYASKSCSLQNVMYASKSWLSQYFWFHNPNRNEGHAFGKVILGKKIQLGIG
jgi:hypothetical protein